jgi:Lrp/AsnC family leucine-responsive transcriptional regulator
MTIQTTLNRIDRKILKILQDDGRISYAELARRVGLSTTPCIERVKKMENSGLIKKYAAIVDPQQLGAGLIVFVQIRLDRTSAQTFSEFKQAVAGLDEVQECHLVTGSFDYLIKARMADMGTYRRFLEETLLAIPGVQASTSIVVMEVTKETMSVAV